MTPKQAGFSWSRIDHDLVRQRSTGVRQQFNALLAKGPTHIEEEQIAGLADQLFDIYRNVCELQGFPPSPILIGTVYGQIAQVLKVRIDSLVSGLRKADRRSGGLQNSKGRQLAFTATKQRLASLLRRNADARVRELSYAKHLTVDPPAFRATKGQETPATILSANQGLSELQNDHCATNRAAFGILTEERPRSPVPVKDAVTASEERGRKRAADVVRVTQEISGIRSRMNCDEDYDRLKAEYPDFILFRICDLDPGLKLLFLGIKWHHQRKALRFAKQVAAEYNEIKLNTIEKAWDLYNPNKQTRTIASKRSTAQKPAKPLRSPANSLYAPKYAQIRA